MHFVELYTKNAFSLRLFSPLAEQGIVPGGTHLSPCCIVPALISLFYLWNLQQRIVGLLTFSPECLVR